jgi:hypothetical protein
MPTRRIVHAKQGANRVNPKQNPVRPTEIPHDVEARYKAIQDEIQRLQPSPEVLAGETREARYARQRRLRQLRREFDAASRYPLARRQRSGATTVVLMAGLGILLCMLSVGGGVLVNNILNRPPDITGTITNFMDDIKAQNYSDAHTYLSSSAQDVQSFLGTASTADDIMGVVTKYQKTGQINGLAGQTSATVTFTVNRAGNDQDNGYDKSAPASYSSIVIIMNYINGAWQILDYGSLFSAPSPTTPTPAPASPTPTPSKGK